MLRVFLVIQAEVIEQVGVDGEELGELDGPRLGVGFGIVDGEVDVETAVVHTMEHKGTKSQKSKGKGQKSKVKSESVGCAAVLQLRYCWSECGGEAK